MKAREKQGPPQGETIEEATNRLTNRHIARLLAKMGEVAEVPEMTAGAVKAELHWLKDDILSYLLER